MMSTIYLHFEYNFNRLLIYLRDYIPFFVSSCRCVKKRKNFYSLFRMPCLCTINNTVTNYLKISKDQVQQATIHKNYNIYRNICMNDDGSSNAMCTTLDTKG